MEKRNAQIDKGGLGLDRQEGTSFTYLTAAADNRTSKKHCEIRRQLVLRERERVYTYIYIHMYRCMYKYIYIYECMYIYM